MLLLLNRLDPCLQFILKLFLKKNHFTYKMNWPNWYTFHYLFIKHFFPYTVTIWYHTISSNCWQLDYSVDFSGFQIHGNDVSPCMICHKMDGWMDDHNIKYVSPTVLKLPSNQVMSNSETYMYLIFQNVYVISTGGKLSLITAF